MSERVVLFVDAQNVYHGARNAFFQSPGSHVEGQIDPSRMGQLISSRGPAGSIRVLHEVRIYTGRPESSKQPRAYGAHMKQCVAWERAGCLVIPRTLRYPFGWPQRPAEEKGIDVALAIDFVMGAVDGAYDIGVIFSTDTDLRPALEVVSARFAGMRRAEVAAWRSPTANRRLSIPGRSIWCHFLDQADYSTVHDPSDYNM